MSDSFERTCRHDEHTWCTACFESQLARTAAHMTPPRKGQAIPSPSLWGRSPDRLAPSAQKASMSGEARTEARPHDMQNPPMVVVYHSVSHFHIYRSESP